MDGTEHQIKEGQILSGRFKLLHKIGQGSFGEVYKTENLETGDILAAKFEFKQKSSISFLVREVKVLT
jgi:serine/threonine protein kinase